jgi:hypothetical protein
MRFTPLGASFPEMCDEGGVDSTTCNGNNKGNNGPGSCRMPSCGDGYTNAAFTPPGSAPETCDDGIDSTTCNGNNNGKNGPGSCQKPSCGDGYTNAAFTPPGAFAPERCDEDGVDSQTCNGNNNGKNGRGSCAKPKCGDGYVNKAFTPPNGTAQEECDKGDPVLGIFEVPCENATKTCNSACRCP